MADNTEALNRKAHKERMLKAVAEGYTLTGVRLSNPKDEHASGVVVTLDAAEGKAIVDAIKKVLEARK